MISILTAVGLTILAGIIGSVPDQALTITSNINDLIGSSTFMETVLALATIAGTCLLYVASGSVRSVTFSAAVIAVYGSRLANSIDAGVQRLAVLQRRQGAING